jgi:hypothetical protein
MAPCRLNPSLWANHDFTLNNLAKISGSC